MGKVNLRAGNKKSEGPLPNPHGCLAVLFPQVLSRRKNAINALMTPAWKRLDGVHVKALRWCFHGSMNR